jgi:hypothetical protein
VERGISNNYLCGCGDALKDCTFWGGFESRLFPFDRDVQDYMVASKSIDRNRYMLFFPLLGKRINKFLFLIENIYSQIFLAVETSTIIDSSKHPSYCSIVAFSKKYDVRVIHLVRNPFQVVQSWASKKHRKEVSGVVQLMPIYPIWKSAVDWVFQNILIEIFLGRRKGKYIRVRYEDFLVSPNEVVAEIFNQFDIDVRAGRGDDFSHSVGGNPDKHEKGKFREIRRAKNKWRQGKGNQFLVCMICCLVMKRYGYKMKVDK